MPEFLDSRFNWHVVNLAILSKTSSLFQKFLETQSQRRKDVPLGESWIVHIFHRMRKEAILLLHIQENTWQIIVRNS
jgi:hypothetical protein